MVKRKMEGIQMENITIFLYILTFTVFYTLNRAQSIK